ncbi:class I SAM-dependent methyltransferase [Candidatus Woesearchaeota archaeon]|nr:class I SAM-dependent methyltransferase [Candidatus Woesearchaeota archaeon]
MKCDNCESENIKELYKLSYMNINECKDCGLRFTDKSSVVSKDIYNEDYYKTTNKDFFKDCWSDYESKTSKKLARFRKNLFELEKYSKKGNILDLGCATGVFLDMAQKNGWKSYGVEISKFASNYARKEFKLNVKTGDLLNAKLKNNFFDVITMWDFIEHVDSPSKVLSRINKIMKKDGVLFILTINDASLMGKLADIFYKLKIKKFAELVHPVHHNYHFTKKVLIDILNRNGFEVIEMKKSEMPIENIRQGFLVKSMAGVLYFFSNLLKYQHEITIIARKK